MKSLADQRLRASMRKLCLEFPLFALTVLLTLGRLDRNVANYTASQLLQLMTRPREYCE